VRARRGPRPPRDEAAERSKIEGRETEQWIDEGSVRDEAAAATRRAGGRRDDRPSAELDPAVAAEIHAELPPERARRLTERLASAAAALDRERFEEARRMVTPLLKELPRVAAVHEVHGLACYRLGRWKQAAQSLELARQLHPDPSLLPVLADCYRALRRWSDVDAVWDDIKHASPAHDVMAEGRIVVANALAERGELRAAIALMETVSQRPKRVRDHHLRQWYVLGDLYDRAGDTLAATNWFGEVARREPGFADVRERLRSLGR
jgi:tetratricopeptide (TPR) repeat protein